MAKKKKESKACFTVEFPLVTEKFQEDILNKRFEIGRQIYNGLLNVTQKRYREMVKTKKYRGLYKSLTGDKKADKPVWAAIEDMRKEFRFSKYDFYADVKPMQHHFKENIDSKTARSIADSIWTAYDKLFHGCGKQIHFKKFGQLNTLSGQTWKSGIRFKNDHILWNGLDIPIKIDYQNIYEFEAMQREMVYCRIVRKFIRGRNKYYTQILFRGRPPVKYDKETGEVRERLGKGDVGLDIGTSTIAAVGETSVKLQELADKVQNVEDKKRRVLRKMDRSRRATNPDNYNEDGTIRKQGNKKVKWVRSNRYNALAAQLKELSRKSAAIRKYQHECLANEILEMGDTFYVEQMNFAGLQKRAKKTEKNEAGKFKRKKRFGKSLANRAPSMLLEIIGRKLKYEGKELIRIDTFAAKASQFNHIDGTYTKKKLSQRWNDLDGRKVQRDLYSAFLIMNIAEDLKGFDPDKCNKRFDRFYEMHNQEVERLTGKANVSSIGI